MTDWLMVLTGVALTALLGFGMLGTGIGIQSAAIGQALTGGAPRPTETFNRALQDTGSSLVNFDAIGKAALASAIQTGAADQEGTYAFFQGAAAGFVDNLYAELSALLNPIDTALALVELGKLLATDLTGTVELLFDELVVDQLDKLINGTDYEKGYVVANQISATKALSLLAKASGSAVLLARVKKLDQDGSSRVRKVNGRAPINSKRYAGRTIPLEDLSKELRGKYPHSVPFSGAGFPDFSRYSIRNLRIKPGITRGVDFRRADKAAGFSRRNPRPTGYTWHHHQDTGYMQLVPTDIHDFVKHTGGIATGR